MSSKVYDVHEPKPDCEAGMFYLADKSKIEEPYSQMISLIWAAVLIAVFFYALHIYLRYKRKALGLSVQVRYKVHNVGTVEFSEGEKKRRVFLIGLDQGSTWCGDCISSVIEKLGEDSLKCEIIVVGRSIPPAIQHHQGVTRYVSADPNETSHLQKLLPNDQPEYEDSIVYFASPSHLGDWIDSDVEKRLSWDAPVNTITHSIRDESTVKRIILVSSAFVLCESTTARKPRLPTKGAANGTSPKTSVNSYFSHLRSVENLLLSKAGKKVDTFVLRAFETQELISNSPYGHYLRKLTCLRDQRCFVTPASLLAGRISQLLTGHHAPEREVTSVGEETNAQDFLMTCTPMQPCSLVYFLHKGLHRPLIHLNQLCYRYLGRTPFGVHFNYSTYALFNKFISLPTS